jgi:hypothetical protein
LATKGKDNLRHRVGLVEILEGEEELKGSQRKKLVIGGDCVQEKHSASKEELKICQQVQQTAQTQQAEVPKP